LTIKKQLDVEKRVEAALLNWGMPPDELFQRRHELRNQLFYYRSKEGEALKVSTLEGYLRQFCEKGFFFK
jgi:hypothetical protein